MEPVCLWTAVTHNRLLNSSLGAGFAEEWVKSGRLATVCYMGPHVGRMRTEAECAYASCVTVFFWETQHVNSPQTGGPRQTKVGILAKSNLINQ